MFVQVIAGAPVVIIAVALAGIVAARRLVEAETGTTPQKTSDRRADTVVQPVLDDGHRHRRSGSAGGRERGGPRPGVEPVLDRRVKIWNPDSHILYSDEPRLSSDEPRLSSDEPRLSSEEPRLIGRTFPPGEEEQDLFTDPQTRAEVSDLQAPENQVEWDSGKLLEAYRPVWTHSATPLRFES